MPCPVRSPAQRRRDAGRRLRRRRRSDQKLFLNLRIPSRSTLPSKVALPNGLNFHPPEYSSNASRCLAVKAGSLFSHDQQGLAHLIEHMAFNGSAHLRPASSSRARIDGLD